MTSIEMVKYLNDEREFNPDAYAAVRHSQFMDRVPKVIGEATATKFLAPVNYFSGNGAISTRDIYTFPKREACLMAMSYSYELQAKVFDKMTSFATSTLSMSTREIAELTGKMHTNVIRDFREVCEALEINQLSFESVYLAKYLGSSLRLSFTTKNPRAYLEYSLAAIPPWPPRLS